MSCQNDMMLEPPLIEQEWNQKLSVLTFYTKWTLINITHVQILELEYKQTYLMGS